MKRVFQALTLCLCCISCTQTQSNVSKEEGQSEVQAESKAPEKPSLEAEDPAKYVEEVYRLVGVAYSEFPPKTSEFEGKVVSKGWKEACDLVMKRDEEISKYDEDYIGFFDADYWIMGQDIDQAFGVRDIKTQMVQKDKAVVSIIVHNFSDTEVEVTLVREDGKWKVDNLKDVKADIDWRKGMAEYTHEMTTNPRGE